MPNPKQPPSPLLAWLKDRDALVRRFILAEVLGPPRGRAPAKAAPPEQGGQKPGRGA
jgi:hypothetical protein